MSELPTFTVTLRHIAFIVWLTVWSIPFTARNKNGYYDYSGRVMAWFSGLIIGLIGAFFIL
jgi:hypothetical protein